MNEQRKRIPSDLTLTQEQKEIIVATLLTDGWIEFQPKSKNPRIGLQLSDTFLPLMNWWIEKMGAFIANPETEKRYRGAPGSGDKLFLQHQKRTGAHKEFHQFLIAFDGKGAEKKVPKVSYLKEYLSPLAVAVMLMMDGSRHSEQSRAMELHLQGFLGFESQARLCVALYEKFGIKASVTKYGESLKGEQQYHVHISGESLPIIIERIKPLMLPFTHYKVPEMGARAASNASQMTFNKFYNFVKNKPYLEDLNAVEENPSGGITTADQR